VLDDERLKAGRTLGEDYFDELLERIGRSIVDRTNRMNRITRFVLSSPIPSILSILSESLTAA
jgi:hypothetical protein